MDYLNLLEHSYAQVKDFRDDCELERLEFIAEEIFGFTTYENVISSLMAKKCLEVCKAINDRTTYSYILTAEGNQWYLIMVNMPFFNNKLVWGSSIRGAWWDLVGNDHFTIKSCGLWQDDEQLLEVSFDKSEWGEFIEAMIKFTDF